MNQKITFPELVNAISESTGYSKHLSEEFLKELFSLIANTLASGENVKIKKLGTFKVIDVDARKSVKVGTGEEIEIPEHRKISFTPDKELAEAINLPFAAFETIELKDSVTDEMLDSETIELSAKEEKPTVENTPLPLTTWDEEDEDDEEDESKAESYDTEAEPQQKQEEEISPTTDSDKPTEEEVIGCIENSATEENTANENSADKENINTPISSEVAHCESDDAEQTPIHSNIDEEYSCDDAPTRMKNNRRGFLPGFLFGIVASAAICAVIYFFVLNPDTTDKNTEKVIAEQSNINNNSPQPLTDSISEVKEEKIEESNVVIPQTKPSDEVVYDTISLTRFLTTMAREHYGNYHLWPYIYEENSKILGHPDRIRPGTRVVIPSKEKYNINPDDPECIKQAKRKGVEIYNRYKK